MSDGGAAGPLLPDDGVGEDGPEKPLSSAPPTTGSACTTVVAVGDCGRNDQIGMAGGERVGEMARSVRIVAGIGMHLVLLLTARSSRTVMPEGRRMMVGQLLLLLLLLGVGLRQEIEMLRGRNGGRMLQTVVQLLRMVGGDCGMPPCGECSNWPLPIDDGDIWPAGDVGTGGSALCFTTGLSSDVSRHTFSRFLCSLEPDVTEMASGWTVIMSASSSGDAFPMYSWKLPREEDFTAGVTAAPNWPAGLLLPFSLVLVRDSFMLPPELPPCCFRSRLENCRLSTEHHTFSPFSSVIQ
uniref:Uncharacterized protein n=1 Tax=Anopheles merus TaxID=30066 RepID=A0A182UT70_ANOME